MGFNQAAMAKPAAVGGFDPFSLAWKVAVWADDPDWTNPGNGNAVSSWRDGSGNGFNAVQATGANQPIYRSSVALLNNRAAVDFDGVNDLLTASTTLSAPFSGIWIGKRDGAGTGSNPRVLHFNTAGGYEAVLESSMTGNWAAYYGTFIDSGVNAVATPVVALRVLMSDVTHRISVNGTLSSQASGGPPSMAAFGIGFGDGEAANIHTAFAACAVGDITADANWSAFVSWVSNYYGLTIS